MPEIQTAELEDRGVVSVTGTDAGKLLQGLITNDLDTLKPGCALFAGLLSPQGKILFDFFVVPKSNGYLIDIAKQHVATFIKRLTLYRLRADVTLEASPESQVMAGWDDTRAENSECDATVLAKSHSTKSVTFTDPRHADLGVRMLMDKSDGVSATSQSENYHAHRIGLGIPEGDKDYAFSDTYPHEALYDALHGVSFTKGCFIGQEVVSRMEHRNATKKRIVKVHGSGLLPDAGTEITAGDIVLGRLGSHADTAGLALIRVDRMKDVAKRGAVPSAQDIELQFTKPAWATYEL